MKCQRQKIHNFSSKPVPQSQIKNSPDDVHLPKHKLKPCKTYSGTVHKCMPTKKASNFLKKKKKNRLEI